MKTKGVIEDLKFFKKLKKRKKKKRMIVKIEKMYLGLYLVLWAVWGQFIFGEFLDLAYISQDL